MGLVELPVRAWGSGCSLQVGVAEVVAGDLGPAGFTGAVEPTVRMVAEGGAAGPGLAWCLCISLLSLHMH